MNGQNYSNEFIKLLEKNSKDYTIADKLTIMDKLQAIFNYHEVSDEINKSDLILISDLLARIAYAEMKSPCSLETVEYERTKMIAIAKFLKILDREKGNKLLYG